MYDNKRELLWSKIHSFIRDAKTKTVADLNLNMSNYKGLKMFGSFKSGTDETNTVYMVFMAPGQEINNGIFLSIYINRRKTGKGFFEILNLELCYSTSEKNYNGINWNRDALGTVTQSASERYRKSLCVKRISGKSIHTYSDVQAAKDIILNTLDKMIDVYTDTLDGKYENFKAQKPTKNTATKTQPQKKSVPVAEKTTDVPVVAHNNPGQPKPDPEQMLLFRYIENTNNNLVIQGKAGSGKSFLIKYLTEHTSKNIVVLAPTAIAAININGATPESYFLFNWSAPRFYDYHQPARINKNVITKIRATDLMVIDEMSMLAPYKLDLINKYLQVARGNKLPFGGIQIVLVGDICQLPPVITGDDTFNDFLITEYGCKNPYFFDAHSFKAGNFGVYQLTKSHRQKEDDDFLDYLNAIRMPDSSNLTLQQVLKYFNKCKIRSKSQREQATIITARRQTAIDINQEKLDALPGDSVSYTGILEGAFEKTYNRDGDAGLPVPLELQFKVGTLVMFIRNNYPSWVNGATGIIESMERDSIQVRIVAPKNLQSYGQLVDVKRDVWEKTDYEITPGGNLSKKAVGKYTQFPLMLGYARTIHKMQGITLDNVIIDMSGGHAFASGQMYVALSRVREKKGIHLIGELHEKDIILDPRIKEFLTSKTGNLTPLKLRKYK